MKVDVRDTITLENLGRIELVSIGGGNWCIVSHRTPLLEKMNKGQCVMIDFGNGNVHGRYDSQVDYEGSMPNVIIISDATVYLKVGD